MGLTLRERPNSNSDETVDGLKMGPKHKGFPMTQSIHFDQERKKGLGLTPIRGPRMFDYGLKMFIKTSFENLINKVNQTKIFTQRNGSYTYMEAQVYIYKKGWVLYLRGEIQTTSSRLPDEL